MIGAALLSATVISAGDYSKDLESWTILRTNKINH